MQAVYVDNTEEKLSSVTVNYGKKNYTFYRNVPVIVDKQILMGIIGNWEKRIDWDKEVISGSITPQCPRDKIYAIIGTKGVNLFRNIELPQEVLHVLNLSIKEIVPESKGVVISDNEIIPGNEITPEVDDINSSQVDDVNSHPKRGRKKK